MKNKTQSLALRLADEFKLCNEYDSFPSMNDIAKAETELRRLHAQVQELGQMLRKNRSKRIVALEAENLGLLHALAAEQDANTDLRQQLESIGAGGVEPLRRDHFRDATEIMPEKQKTATYQQVVAAWNAQADEYNQWDSLGEDEKIEWALKKCCDQFHGATK